MLSLHIGELSKICTIQKFYTSIILSHNGEHYNSSPYFQLKSNYIWNLLLKSSPLSEQRYRLWNKRRNLKCLCIQAFKCNLHHLLKWDCLKNAIQTSFDKDFLHFKWSTLNVIKPLLSSNVKNPYSIKKRLFNHFNSFLKQKTTFL